MMRGLEARVSRLEQALVPQERLVVVIFSISSPGERLYGYQCKLYGHESLDVIRKPGESDEDLLDRAKKEANISGLAVNGVLGLLELSH